MLKLTSVALLSLLAPGGGALASTLTGLISSGCATDGPVSCQNTTAVSNTCCFEYPGGQILQTQFWDTDVAGSPADSWTIHGLWPDNCDGTYEEDCDPSRDYTNITDLLTSQGATSTLDYMEDYWLNDDGTAQELWAHEWATHGTCYSTLEPSCLPSGSPAGAEAVAFFETVVRVFKTLPTYTWLADAGITPDDGATYELSDVLGALESGSGGYTPAVSCDDDALSAISWYFNLQGSVIDGTFIQIDATDDSSCPSSGIKYPPKESSDSDGSSRRRRGAHRRSSHRGRGMKARSEL
ncbi:ribonuclease T2 [Coniophora puteana RWD-64-598 SS2]|uniref:ribonuclease T2 n=1 Tax=Coniophora puteana (strain RWD-64-598) TaxID=741705 RepID=A0A5M3MGA4_CONPW|nr:ribonuclease T2 [Coniophora puteana RWD-64-598 SS2]EIW77960.1 ribonuclease T2 [Coniophora puteana RWD-64-598 SS2]